LRLDGIIFSKHRPIAIYFISTIYQGPSNLYPLYPQQNFPDLMHVNFLPDATEVIPALEQDAQALAMTFAGFRGRVRRRENINKNVALSR
jgi:hypothetical protein